CDLMSHTLTQMPYALTVGGLSIVCGTIPLGFGVPVSAVLGLQAVAIVVVILTCGTRVESQVNETEPGA
ncbi:MAG: Na+/H+ antiporter NhaC family protein, partial [Planctomycetaceae bacterium]